MRTKNKHHEYYVGGQWQRYPEPKDVWALLPLLRDAIIQGDHDYIHRLYFMCGAWVMSRDQHGDLGSLLGTLKVVVQQLEDAKAEERQRRRSSRKVSTPLKLVP